MTDNVISIKNGIIVEKNALMKEETIKIFGLI